MGHARGALLLLSVAAMLLVAGAASAESVGSPWAVPKGGSCTRAGRSPDAAPEDATALPFQPGAVIELAGYESLRHYLPEEMWERRERFFFDGMKLEIGPCYRDYAPPAFFREATERFRGRARLGEDGSLEGHTAGLPFHPEDIAPDDPAAAVKWAWNWVYRFQGAGRFGELRLSTVEGRDTTGHFEGSFFWVRIAGRAERAGDGYRFPAKTSSAWVSGGETKNKSSGETCAWRQHASTGRRPDLFFWHPAARKVERANAPDVEGPLMGCLAGGYGSLLLHGGNPHLHRWTLVGVRDLLAPINASRPSYPESRERDFGPWGISFASDRWELRRAIVLEARLREGQFEDGVVRFRWYLDLQTLFPLYYAAYRESGSAGGVGHFVGRWSEDRDGYAPWPDDPERPVRVLDVVGEALVDWSHTHAARVEAWNTVATPPPDKTLQRMLSQAGLRGH